MNPQKSEIHETTADAGPEEASTANDKPQPKRVEPDRPHKALNPKELYPPGVQVKRDESDEGGPIDIEVDQE